MDPTIAQAFAMAALTASQNATERAASQSIFAQQDNRMLTSWAAQVMAQATNPGQDAALLAASHMPTSQPYVAPNFVQPTGQMAAGAAS
jgi:hypothetical protein